MNTLIRAAHNAYILTVEATMNKEELATISAYWQEMMPLRVKLVVFPNTTYVGSAGMVMPTNLKDLIKEFEDLAELEEKWSKP